MGAGSHLPHSFGTGKALFLRGLILEIVPPTSAHTDGRCLAIKLMVGALNALRCAVVLTNEHGTILHANRSAEHARRGLPHSKH
jgi:hypothetical protein